MALLNQEVNRLLASQWVRAVPQSTDVRPMVETARTLNPGIGIVARAEDEDLAALLRAAGVDGRCTPRPRSRRRWRAGCSR